MPHWMECVLNGYLVVAAIGFPICLPWALQNHEDMNANYKIGFENGKTLRREHEAELMLRSQKDKQ